MARIRTIKPEFWDSPSTARASAVARLAFIGMWNWADDFGRGTANLKELEGFIFPNDDIAELSGGKSRNFRDVVAEVSECFGVAFYTVGGRPYYAIPSWQKHQRNERSAKPKFPGPDDADKSPTCDDASKSVKERNFRQEAAELPTTSDAGTGEQGNRGTEEQDSSSGVADATPRPEVEELLDLLDEGIDLNGLRVPSRNKRNRDAMRLLIDRDGYTAEQVAWIIRWACGDEFWRTNILSASKLREKFPQLVAKSGAGAKPRVVGFGGEIDVDAILGRDLWSLPSPPDDITPGTPAYREWADQQRAARRAQRLEEARAVIARRGA